MRSLNLFKGYPFFIFIFLIVSLTLVKHAYADELKDRDPFKRFNRVMFNFNEKLDIFIFKPVATFYNKVIPKPLNKGIHNVFKNINNLPTIANDILQLHFYQMTHDTWRLVINSTLGIGGLFDVAERMGLQPYSNDFGLTLAKYGWHHSTYLVLPFFGPNTIRDGIEIPVDYAFSIYPWINDNDMRTGLLALSVVDRRAQFLNFQSVMEEVSYDKYVFTRNAYLQRRAYQIEQNQAQRILKKSASSQSNNVFKDTNDQAESKSEKLEKKPS